MLQFIYQKELSNELKSKGIDINDKNTNAVLIVDQILNEQSFDTLLGSLTVYKETSYITFDFIIQADAGTRACISIEVKESDGGML